MNKTKDSSNKQLINALTRGLIILETILEKDVIGITEMSKILGVNKSSAYRLISTLEEREYVEQDPVSTKYKLGLKFISFGEKSLASLEIREISKPYLKDLTSITKEASHLCILFQSQALFINQESSPERLSVNTYIGMFEPIYCSAVGKALLSHLPANEQEKIIKTLEIKAFTPRTITDLDVLRHELKKTLQRGYAVDDEELSTGLRCIAAPIFNHKGEVIASIGISGPVTRIRTDNLNEYVVTVVNTAYEISKKTGFRALI